MMNRKFKNRLLAYISLREIKIFNNIPNNFYLLFIYLFILLYLKSCLINRKIYPTYTFLNRTNTQQF